MAGAVALGGEIADVLLRPAPDDALVGHNLKSSFLQRGDFQRVIGHHAHPRHAQHLQHDGGVIKAALIVVETEHFVGVVGIETLRLQFVGADLVGKPVAATFLIQIQQHAAAILRHETRGVAQLVAAIAFEAAEQIAGQAGRMKPHGDDAAEIRLADDDGDLIAQPLAAAEHNELGIGRAFERHGRPPDDPQILNARGAVTLDRAGVDANEPLPLDGAGGNLRRDDGGENEREAREFEGRMIELAQGRDRRVDARANLKRKGGDAPEVDHRQGDGPRAGAVKAKATQTRGWQQKPGATIRQAGDHSGPRLVQRLDADHDNVRTARTDDDRATGAQLGQRAIDRYPSDAAVGLQNMLDICHATLDAGNASPWSGVAVCLYTLDSANRINRLGAVMIEAGRERANGRDPLAPIRAANPARPFVVAQLGQSLDGRIATITGESRYINRAAALDHLHRMRASVDAVVVGAGTIAADDPLLTVRRVGGRSPARVVIDPSGRLGADKRWLARDGVARYLVSTSEKAPAGAELIRLPATDGALAPADIVAALFARGLRRLLIEGGAQTISRFIDAGQIDRLHLMVAPVIIGSGKTGLDLAPIAALSSALRPRVETFSLGDGEILFDCDLRERLEPDQ